MGIEVATYINDLQVTNPPPTDPKSQGADHLRLIKQVLQNTFPSATRAYQIPGVVSYSGGTTLGITKSNGSSTIYVNTATGPVVVALPSSLGVLDAGWSCNFIKTTSDANPMFITPASGVINSGGIAGLAKARRCIPGVACSAIWDGANWFVTRVTALPIRSLIPFYGTTLPTGYEWPSGTALSAAANYPEYNSLYGLTTPDVRGCTLAALDNLGGTAAGRLPSGYIAQTTLGALGGVDGVTLSAAQMPVHNHSASSSDGGHTHTYSAVNANPVSAVTGGGGLCAAAPQTYGTGTGYSSISTSIGNAGSGGQHNNLQPTVMCGFIMVVE